MRSSWEDPPPLSGSMRGRRSRRYTAIGTVQVIVGMLVLLVGFGAATAVYSRAEVGSSIDRLQSRWVPARDAAGALRQGYTDQGAGVLGYLLTGNSAFHQRYETGQRAAAQAQAKLARLLPGDTTITALLAALSTAADRWRTTAVETQIAARQLGPIPAPALLRDIAATSSLFDVVRSRMSTIDAHTREMESDQLNRVQEEQSQANVVTAIAVGVTVLVAGLGALGLRRTLVGPARVLLDDVNTVASGAYQHPITEAGPSEFAAVSDAVDRMRTSILRHADD
ncbi:MAG: hypothetical protein QOH57_3237, partial [Mycobacterium sp.]|nr:hypothetical protein [Mycobacterium sp.]